MFPYLSFIEKKVLLFVIGVFTTVLCFGQSYNKELQKLEMAYQIISTFYVDSVNEGKMTEDAIVNMLKGLDPHSVYITADEVAAMNEPLNGSFDGIGIEFNLLNDTIIVINPILGGPSDKLGIKAGDRIVEIDGKNVGSIGLKNSDVLKLLRGPKGTQVDVKVVRKNSPALLSFSIIRNQIPIYSIDAKYMLDTGIGYIKISRFAATTHAEFIEALTNLKRQNLTKLILDLRGNGGGYLNAAIDIADEFLGKNKLIVYTHGVASPRHEHVATARGMFETGSLIVLIDEGSASASEIVAGAIQDWDRGVVMGRRSFGKGLVQRPFNLPDGSMMRLTIANYYTPSGRSIQKPYNEGVDAYYGELSKRFGHGELAHRDSIKLDEKLKTKTLISARPIFGGGGIMPDVFIPADTSMYSNYYRDIIANGVLNGFIVSYMDSLRSELKTKYKDLSSFDKKFQVTDDLIAQLQNKASAKKIQFNEAEYQISEKLIRIQIKSLIARDLWGISEYFQLINPFVDSYSQALELMHNEKNYNQILK